MSRIMPPHKPKRIKIPPSHKLVVAYFVVKVFAFVLVLFLAAGTIYAFLRSPGSGPLFRIGAAHSEAGQALPGSTGAAGNDTIGVFTGIGRLRIPLAGGGTLILSLAFPYPLEDAAFTEELAAKIGDFRNITIDYFSSLPAEKTVNLDESAAKAEIIRRCNAVLRLGSIQALYFSDLMVIE